MIKKKDKYVFDNGVEFKEIIGKGTDGGWISVKDRLPKKSDSYYCYWWSEYTKKGKQGCKVFRNKDREFTMNYNERGLSYKVTHWMDLPKSPKAV